MHKTLYISDLDGTLLNSDSQISKSSAEILNRAISAGANFSVATARTPATVADLLSEVNTKLPMVVMTGATLWNRANGQYTNTCFIPENEALKVVDIYRSLGFSSFVYTLHDNKLHIYHLGELSPQEADFMQEREENPFKRFHIPTDGNSKLPTPLNRVVLFYGVRPNAESICAHEMVKNSVTCSPLCYNDIYGPEIAVAEVFASQATKARGVNTLAQSIGATRIVAFGDNINDLPMLRAADVAVAVENAVDEVKKAADIIIGSNNADSVARFILDDFTSSNSQHHI